MVDEVKIIKRLKIDKKNYFTYKSLAILQVNYMISDGNEKLYIFDVKEKSMT